MVQLALDFDTIYPVLSVVFSFLTLFSVIILRRHMKSNAVVLSARLYTSRVKYWSFFVLFFAALSFMIGYLFFTAGYIDFLFFGASNSSVTLLNNFNSYTDLIAFGSVALFFFILSYNRSEKLKLDREVTASPAFYRYLTGSERESKKNTRRRRRTAKINIVAGYKVYAQS